METHRNTVERVRHQLGPLRVAGQGALHLRVECFEARLPGPRRVHHHVHAGLPDHRGAELGGDGLLQHRHHPGVHVDDLGVPAADAALAHVALAAGHEAGHLEAGVRGAHLGHHLLETVELRSFGVDVVLVHLTTNENEGKLTTSFTVHMHEKKLQYTPHLRRQTTSSQLQI